MAPVSVVRTAAEEEAWERAKQAARRQYPDATGDRFYRIVMHIYKKMTGYTPRAVRLNRHPVRNSELRPDESGHPRKTAR